MNTLRVHAPLAGRLVALGEVPDPVFAREMVGPGIAIDPSIRRGTVEVASPIAGVVAALHPHAFAIEATGGAALVHLGLDTVTLQGRPFEVMVEPREKVERGQIVIRWRIEEIGGLSPLVPVVALGAREVQALAEPGAAVERGAALFDITA